MARSDKVPANWWGDFELSAGETEYLEIGPFHLWITRLSEEWSLAYERIALDDDQPVEWSRTAGGPPVPDSATKERYIFSSTMPDLKIIPALADRPVVTRPVTPFYLPEREEITAYVSSPLWTRIGVHKEKSPLRELPIVRPSDTWFGPSTLEGELCYAMRTSARLRLEELPMRPHRAITPVVLKNHGKSPLFLERLSIPVTFLPLFGSKDGLLWTPQITLVREEESEMAALKIDEQPPGAAHDPIRLCEPRQTASLGMLFRAFSALFSVSPLGSRHVRGEGST